MSEQSREQRLKMYSMRKKVYKISLNKERKSCLDCVNTYSLKSPSIPVKKFGAHKMDEFVHLVFFFVQKQHNFIELVQHYCTQTAQYLKRLSYEGKFLKIPEKIRLRSPFCGLSAYSFIHLTLQIRIRLYIILHKFSIIQVNRCQFLSLTKHSARTYGVCES